MKLDSAMQEGAASAVPSAAPGAVLLAFRDVRKDFPGVRALKGVSFDVRAGEVHALLGENGAGKSTVVNLIGGVFAPDAGQILLDGEPVHLRAPRDSLHRGVAIIHQELTLLPDVSVAENVFVGRLPRRALIGVDQRRMRAGAREVLDRVGLHVDPDVAVRDLSTGEQQQVEIARAIAMGPRLLVMDEPTSALSEHEVEQLFAVVRRLRDEGLGIMFISHRLAEVRAITDRVTVLRDGEVVLSSRTSELRGQALAEAMVGRCVEEVGRARNTLGEPALVLQGVSTDQVDDVDLTVRHGEVVGLAGAMGAGKTELLRAIAGVDRIRAGHVELDGCPVRVDSPARGLEYGVFLVPEDRKQEGLILGMSVADNITLPYLRSLSRGPFVSRSAQSRVADDFIRRLGIKTPGSAQQIRKLSGGNQQKTVLARWLSMNPRVLLLDQPTRGLDIGAKEDVYAIVQELARNGVAVIFVATEIPELLRVCHRTCVMRDRRIVREFDETATESDIVLAAVGEEDR
jgi:ABC-type sugar transport system ATPase subunit